MTDVSEAEVEAARLALSKLRWDICADPLACGAPCLCAEDARAALTRAAEVREKADDAEHQASMVEIGNLRNEIERLRAECFALAAGTCHGGYGDEGGNWRCDYQDTIKGLQAVLNAVAQGGNEVHPDLHAARTLSRDQMADLAYGAIKSLQVKVSHENR